MLKRICCLAAIATIGLLHAAPASAHFSQVFGSFKAQVIVDVHDAVPMTCEGRYTREIGADWLVAHSE